MATKMEAPRLLGVLPNETEASPMNSTKTGKPYTTTVVASKLDIPRNALYPWIKKRKGKMLVSGNAAKKANNLRDGDFHTLEKALYRQIIHKILVLNGMFPYKEREMKRR